MNLLDLPKEILDSTWKSVSFSGLFALSLTSKALRTLIEPWLYSNIEMTWTDERTPPIIPLLRSLMSRPELSDYVLRLHLGGEGFEFQGTTLPKIPVSELELDEVVEFIQWTEVPYANLWIDDLQSGTMDAIVALLLALLPNLNSLQLHGSFALETRLLGKMLRSALCQGSDEGLPKFRGLREVTFHALEDPWHDSRLRKTTDILSFFHLPAVERMSLTIDNPVRFCWPLEEPAPPFLTSLELYRIREARIGPLLSACTKLETLHWNWFYQPDIDPKVSKSIIELEDIGDAIAQVRSTLTELEIEATAHAGFDDLDPPVLKTKGSLSSISRSEKLIRVEIPWIFLMGSSPVATAHLRDMIPKSVESLTITDDLAHLDGCEWDEYAIFYAIRTWLESWKSFTPRIRRVKLLLKKSMGEWEMEMRRELQHIFAQAGLELAITKLARDIGLTKTPPHGWVWLTGTPSIMA